MFLNQFFKGLLCLRYSASFCLRQLPTFVGSSWTAGLPTVPKCLPLPLRHPLSTALSLQKPTAKHTELPVNLPAAVRTREAAQRTSVVLSQTLPDPRRPPRMGQGTALTTTSPAPRGGLFCLPWFLFHSDVMRAVTFPDTAGLSPWPQLAHTPPLGHPVGISRGTSPA